MISISPFAHGPLAAVGSASIIDVDVAKVAQPENWLDDAEHVYVFSNARSAILACLRHLGLNASDEVCIQTTSNGPYISSCVTRTIETVCSWSRNVNTATKLLLVIHEFGFPCDDLRMRSLRSLNIPLLEDCAYGVGSRSRGSGVGRYGDFAIYSLPKYYPVPRGGLLASKRPFDFVTNDEQSSESAAGLPDHEVAEIYSQISCGLQVKDQWNELRRDNWRRFAKCLAHRGVAPYFELDSASVPGAFVCSLPPSIHGQTLKRRFVDSGIEATEYYGHGGFYFPVHQFLSEADIGLMLSLFGDVQ
jgi:hypothetical protein